jgi:orotate phosphoribosyltransferase
MTPDAKRESREGAVMLAERSRFLEILKNTSFQAKQEATFRLASGKFSRYYIDCKQALSYPQARDLIAHLIYDRIRGEIFDAVGGLEIGAYPIATSVSDIVFRKTGTMVRAFVVRKEPKTHGIRDLLAGHVQSGDRALIVDDVVTVGTSTIKAIDWARKAGLIVERVIVLVDRQEDDGKKNIEARGVKFEALCTLSELLELADGSDQGSTRKPDQARTVRGQSPHDVTAD